ncbi:MAG: hypothetical protein II670_03415, partial [Alphaproteobacteria bacterium]|nr:hypothetical protein [Alphaproteobacteria bacterium]
MKTINSIIFSVGLLLATNSYSQNQHKGFLPDKCSYQVISQPSRDTKIAQLVFDNTLRFPFLLTDGNMVLLSNDEIKKPIAFILPNEIKDCENIFILDSLLICKYGTSIMSFDGETIDEVLIMEDEQYNIYPANDGFFYLVENKTTSSSVHLIKAATGEATKLFDSPFTIDNIAGTGPESYVTSNEMIYFVSKEVCSLVEIADSKVQSIDFDSNGAFYSTEKACYYLGLPGKSYPFLLGNIKQVILVDN